MFEYCKEKKQLDEPVNLTSLSALLDDQDPSSFITFVREGGYDVCETFSPSPERYRRLQRLSKRFGSINLSFSVEDLFLERVVYSPDDDSIILRNPPRDFVDNIKQAKGERIDGD